MSANEPLNARGLRVSGNLVILGRLVEALSINLEPSHFLLSFPICRRGFLLSGLLVFFYPFVTHFTNTRSCRCGQATKPSRSEAGFVHVMQGFDMLENCLSW